MSGHATTRKLSPRSGERAARMAMLEMTLATRFEPGTNVRGEASGASWTFLLPRLEVERALCLGAPRLSTLRTLARLARKVWVLDPDPRATRRLPVALSRARLENVTVLAPGEAAERLRPASVELVALEPARRLSRVVGEPGVREALTPEARLWFERSAWRPRHAERLARLLMPHGDERVFELTPAFGEAQTAVPASDATVRRHFAARGLEAASARRRVLRPAARLLDSLARARQPRQGVLLTRCAAGPGLPDYLLRLARRSGFDLEGHRFGVVAPGGYDSRKVVFFVFPPGGASPRYVVKLTRAAHLNYRLENEYRTLAWLAKRAPGAVLMAPHALFLGHHGGLAVVGESAVEGVGLRACTRRTPDCPYGRALVAGLVDLAVRTAEPTPAGRVAEALERLLRRFRAIYALGDAEEAFLAHQIARLAALADPIPLVFQHGDPGLWNAVVTADDRVGLLDWEAGEPWGMPLWDLFYLLRSYGIPAGGSHGPRDWLRNSTRHFLGETPLSRFMAEAVRGYCTRVGVPPEALEPLFHTCWMHRALKEATRRTSATVQDARYFGLLRAGMAGRESPGLRRLLARGSATATGA